MCLRKETFVASHIHGNKSEDAACAGGSGAAPRAAPSVVGAAAGRRGAHIQWQEAYVTRREASKKAGPTQWREAYVTRRKTAS